MTAFHRASEDADVMTSVVWLDCVAAGAYVRSDGFGHWAKMIGDTVMESDVDCFDIVGQPEWATHVCWYNK